MICVSPVILRTSNYGAVISHIEPEHLEHVQVPDSSPEIKKEIHDKIVESLKLWSPFLLEMSLMYC
jgi:type I restriction enzyme, S subunit